MIAVGEMTFEQHLFEIAQRRRHRLHALAEFQEMRLDHLLTESAAQEPRPKVPEIP
jgi:hypothetical protein